MALQLFLPFCATRKFHAIGTRRETKDKKKRQNNDSIERAQGEIY